MHYTNPTLLAQRKALVEKLVEAAHVRGRYDGDRLIAIGERLCARIGARPYSYHEDGQEYATGMWHASSEAALKEAVSFVSPANYGWEDESPSTAWVDVQVVDQVLGERVEWDAVQLDPPEPACKPGQSHDWQSPHEVLGGLVENPGVFGHGGGAIIREVCAHCGAYRIRDTWATRPDTGEQGMESVAYEPADERSLTWLAEREPCEG